MFQDSRTCYNCRGTSPNGTCVPTIEKVPCSSISNSYSTPHDCKLACSTPSKGASCWHITDSSNCTCKFGEVDSNTCPEGGYLPTEAECVKSCTSTKTKSSDRDWIVMGVVIGGTVLFLIIFAIVLYFALKK